MIDYNHDENPLVNLFERDPGAALESLGDDLYTLGNHLKNEDCKDLREHVAMIANALSILAYELAAWHQVAEEDAISEP